MLAAMRDLPPLSVLASRFAVLIMVAAFFAACSGSVAPAAVPSTRTLTPPPAAAPPATRASGTVKIHDGNSESEGNANNPKVCTFHLHFFFGAGTSGTWRIDAHPGGSQVLSGAWDSGEAEDVRVPEAPDLFSLPDGQYKLYWTQDGANGQKQKVFKVECAAPTAAPVRDASADGHTCADPRSHRPHRRRSRLQPTPTATTGPTPTPTAAPRASPTAATHPGAGRDPRADCSAYGLSHGPAHASADCIARPQAHAHSEAHRRGRQRDGRHGDAGPRRGHRSGYRHRADSCSRDRRGRAIEPGAGPAPDRRVGGPAPRPASLRSRALTLAARPRGADGGRPALSHNGPMIEATGVRPGGERDAAHR